MQSAQIVPATPVWPLPSLLKQERKKLIGFYETSVFRLVIAFVQRELEPLQNPQSRRFINSAISGIDQHTLIEWVYDLVAAVLFGMIEGIIHGNLSGRLQLDPVLQRQQFEMQQLTEDDGNPGIYVNYLVDDSSPFPVSSSPAQLMELIQDARLYVDNNTLAPS